MTLVESFRAVGTMCEVQCAMHCTAPRLLRQAGLLRLGRRRPLSSMARAAVAESGSAPPVMVERRPVAKGGEVAVITLNRPKHMNALTSDMITELQAQLEAVGRYVTAPPRIQHGFGVPQKGWY